MKFRFSFQVKDFIIVFFDVEECIWASYVVILATGV